MGLLYQGTTLPWDDAKIYADHVRNHGITQFMNISRTGTVMNSWWGDEVRLIVTGALRNLISTL